MVDSVVAVELPALSTPGLAVALAKQGKIIYAQGYGYADLSDCLATQSATPFQIASVTKQFTAAAILQLQSTGALDIDRPVIRYLPSYAFDARLTVRMLLNQVSGLPDYLNGITSVTSTVAEQTVLTWIAHAPLDFRPGTTWEYSNSNYYVLGAIVEAVSSESYSRYLATKITGPLGLTQTSLTQPAGAALPYEDLGGMQAPIWNPSVLVAAGGLWSDVLDLARWDGALFSGRVIPAAQLTEMVTPTSRSQGYGMGWWQITMLNRPFVWHSGALPGATAWNGFFLDDGFSVSLLINVTPCKGTGLGAECLGEFADQLIAAVCTSSPTAC